MFICLPLFYLVSVWQPVINQWPYDLIIGYLNIWRKYFSQGKSFLMCELICFDHLSVFKQNLKQSHALSKLSLMGHHAKSLSFFVQLGLQIKKCGLGRGSWEQLSDCHRIRHQWVHGSSLAKRSSKPLQWQVENVSKTKDDGLLYTEVSWIGSNTSGVVFMTKKSGKFFVLNQNQLISVISIELPCLL